MSFLPTDYKIPEKPSNYMKFKQGENRFRILESPTLGWLYWVNEDGEIRQKDEPFTTGGKPIRLQLDQDVPVRAAEVVKHFWAVPVWNYDDKMIQVLEITQNGIQDTITGYARNKAWGSPVEYDLAVTRTGDKLETAYTVIAEPKTPLDPKIVEKWDTLKKAGFDMEKLFSGEHPHPSSNDAPAANLTVNSNVSDETTTTDQVNIDDLPF